MTRLFALEPPYTRSLPDGAHYEGVVPLRRGPRLVRTPLMGRWHRPRDGKAYRRPGREFTVWSTWCGQAVRTTRAEPALRAAEVPAGESLCGTCEGRAIGAGHPPVGVEVKVALLFEPASSAPAPPRCPATRLWESDVLRLPHRGAFPCPMCGEGTRLRAAGGWHSPRVVVEGHPPGDGLVGPCPFHRWDHPGLGEDGQVRCRCGTAAWRQ